MRCICLVVFWIVSVSLVFPQAPAVEIRAAWLTTNWALDWPVLGASVENQKEDLIQILDELKQDNFNLIFFQTRAQGHVFYNSSIEPQSSYYGRDSNFDPLAFVIDESHKRGMECHAWLVTFPMGTTKLVGATKKRKGRVETKPEYYKLVQGQWYLDPGHPKTRSHLMSIVKEIVNNYDVDGIHFDYIRYPLSTRKFPDETTFRKYGNGKSLYDWRRDNINQLVAEIYDATKSIKQWVQISSSPLGRYKPIDHINPNDGWNAYETVFQDAAYWLKSGKHDLLFPMIYYKGNDFYPFLDAWIENSFGRIVVPGIGIYQMLTEEQNWELQPIVEQIEYTRAHNIAGQAYFRAGIIRSNLKGVRTAIQSFYRYPSKLPALTWLDDIPPATPIAPRVYKDDEGYLHIEWDNAIDEHQLTYTIYASQTEDIIDIDVGSNILETRIRGNSLVFPASVGEYGFYYSVTASDRYHNESKLSTSTYFSHSLNQQ